MCIYYRSHIDNSIVPRRKKYKAQRKETFDCFLLLAIGSGRICEITLSSVILLFLVVLLVLITVLIVVLLVILITVAIEVHHSVLLILVLRDEIAHIFVGLLELHLVHALAFVPVQER